MSRHLLRYLPQQSGHPPLAGKYQGLPDFPAYDELQPYNEHGQPVHVLHVQPHPCANSEYGTEYHLYLPQAPLRHQAHQSHEQDVIYQYHQSLDYSSSAPKFQYYASTIRFVVPYAPQPVPLPYQRDRHQSR